jgi:hypothetical protein
MAFEAAVVAAARARIGLKGLIVGCCFVEDGNG